MSDTIKPHLYPMINVIPITIDDSPRYVATVNLMWGGKIFGSVVETGNIANLKTIPLHITTRKIRKSATA